MSSICPHCLMEVCTLGPQMLQAGFRQGELIVLAARNGVSKSRLFSALVPQSPVTDNHNTEKEIQE